MNTRQVPSLQLVAFAMVTSIVLVACISPELAPADVASPDSLSTIDTFHSAINSNDVDTVLALFAEDGPSVEYRLYVLRWEAHIQEGKIHSLTAISG